MGSRQLTPDTRIASPTSYRPHLFSFSSMSSFPVSVKATTNSEAASFAYPSQSSNPVPTRPGLNVVFLDCHTGSLISFKTFDILFDSSEWDRFASAIESDTLFPNTYVLIATQQGRAGVVSNITDRGRRAIHLLGGFAFQNVDCAKITAWAFVGQHGAGIGTSLDSFSFDARSAELSSIELTDMPPSCRTHVIRATSNGTGYISARILYDNVEFVGSGSNGLNVVVIDPASATVQHVSSFGSSPSDANAFAQLVESKPANWIFAVAFKAFSPSLLSPPIKRALESIGSKVVSGPVSNGMSWVVIGSRTFDDTGVSEVSSQGPSSQANYYFDADADREGQASFILECRGAYNVSLDIVVDGCVLESFKAGPNYNLRIAAISPYTGIVCGHQAYDVRELSDQKSLTEFVEQIPLGYLTAIVYQPPDGFTFPAALGKLLSLMSQLPIELVLPGTMYGLLYRKGSGPARSFYRNISQSADGWSGADTFALTCRVFLTRRPPISRIEAFSAGFFAGNRAYVTIDMRTVEFSRDNRGLNVVAFNGYGTVVNIASFDTWANQTAADRFASLIEELPAGTGVAVVIVDEGTHRLNGRAIQAIKSLGGSKLGSVAYRGSYALIGCKGRSAGCVAEAFSPSGSLGALVKSYTPGAEPGPSDKGNWLSISTYSSSHNNHILLDGVEITPDTTFGLGIQLLAVGQQYPVVDEVLGDNVEGLIEAMREHTQTVYAMYIPGSCSGTRAATILRSFLGSTKTDDLNGKGRIVVGVPGGGSGSALEHMFVEEPVSISFWTGPFVSATTSHTRPRRVKRFQWVVGLGAIGAVVGLLAYIGLFFFQDSKEKDKPAPISGPTAPTTPSTAAPEGVTVSNPIDPPPKDVSKVVRRGLFIAVDSCRQITEPGRGGDPKVTTIGDFKGAAYPNVEKIRAFYANKDGGTFMQSTVFLNDDPSTPAALWPTVANVQEHVRQLVRDTKDGEVALVHIWSHGTSGGPSLPREKPPPGVRNPYNDAVTLARTELQSMIANLSTRINFTFVFNCCHSGRWLGPQEQVPRGIALAGAREDRALSLKLTSDPFGLHNPTLSLHFLLSRCKTGPFPTYEEIRKQIEDTLNRWVKPLLLELKDDDGNRLYDDSTATLYILLQYNPSITDPKRLRWLDAIS
ncbi:hypothetical protein F5148DRAFT_741899 [Russula earlei]|uniref:Uncharacterized protein n=1 Tax=Russula earlei TaxID=71964 RepID=A0ACC0UD59_9AGAM|nr:hypothetical protein F5148DRAFT_741899 [Russula earlei]